MTGWGFPSGLGSLRGICSLQSKANRGMTAASAAAVTIQVAASPPKASVLKPTLVKTVSTERGRTSAASKPT